MACQVLRSIRQNVWKAVGQCLGQLHGLSQRIADRRHVARPAAVQREPRQRAVNVMHTFQRVAGVSSQARAFNKIADRILPPANHADIAGRRG